MASDSAPTFVMLTGSWHKTFHGQPLMRVLENRNIRAVCYQLTQVGLKEVRPTFEDDVQNARDAVMSEINAGHNVVFGMHSYGGVVGSEAVNRMVEAGELDGSNGKGQLLRLVYIAAFMLPAGEEDHSQLINQFTWLSIDENYMLKMADPRNACFNDMSDEDAKPFVDALGHDETYGMAATVTSEKYRQLPCTYLFCERDQCVFPPIQEKMSKGMDVIRLNLGHSPFVGHPEKVALALDDILRG